MDGSNYVFSRVNSPASLDPSAGPDPGALADDRAGPDRRALADLDAASGAATEAEDDLVMRIVGACVRARNIYIYIYIYVIPLFNKEFV